MNDAADFHALSEAAWKDWGETGGGPVAFDTETQGFGWFDLPFCVTVAWRRPDGTLVSHYLEVAAALTDLGVSVAGEILRSADRVIGHNLRFDLQMVAKAHIIGWDDIPTERWEDTETLAHLLNENKRKGLKYIAEHLLGETNDEAEVLAAHRRSLGVKKDEGYHVLDREVVMPYAIKDAEYTLRIWETLHPHVEKDPELFALYRREMELMRVLREMYRYGMRVDTDRLAERIEEYSVRVVEAEQTLRDLAGDEDFNPRSPKQILETFPKLGVTTVEKTDKVALGALAKRRSPAGKFAAAILKYREVQKVYKTYLIGLRDEIADGLLHVNIRQNGARTGRTSSATETGD